MIERRLKLLPVVELKKIAERLTIKIDEHSKKGEIIQQICELLADEQADLEFSNSIMLLKESKFDLYVEHMDTEIQNLNPTLLQNIIFRQNIIIALPRNPNWLFVFWFIKTDNNYKKEKDIKRKFYLRLYQQKADDVTPAAPFLMLEVDNDEFYRYINISDVSGNFHIDIAELKDDVCHSLCRSTVLCMPAATSPYQQRINDNPFYKYLTSFPSDSNLFSSTEDQDSASLYQELVLSSSSIDLDSQLTDNNSTPDTDARE